MTGLDSAILGQRQYDLAVIDEAAQCTEPVCWLPLLRSQCLVLAGDHCQLPPTILSRDAADEGFGISLMERLVGRYGPLVTRRLNVQYRMHEQIMAFSSREFYENGLVAHESVAAHLLCQLPGVRETPLTTQPVTFIDTAGAGYEEEQEPDGESRLNPQEAALAARKESDARTPIDQVCRDLGLSDGPRARAVSGRNDKRRAAQPRAEVELSQLGAAGQPLVPNSNLRLVCLPPPIEPVTLSGDLQ